MLRIDVDHSDPGKNYSSPKDNPFVGREGYRPELWCYGLRNPWRISFDAESGQLWAGNNGQDLWEQTYLIRKGANYGWSVAEGGHPFLHQRKAGLEPISPPTTEHPHSEARSLTGGRVYRGKRFPELVGAYIYGDWSTGRVWGVKHDDRKVVWHRLLADTPFNITGFGTDHAGEMYVIDEVSGFYSLEPTAESDRQARPFPTRLSRTGIFASTAPLLANPAVLPYQVNAPQWADGAKIERLAGIAHADPIEQRSQKNAGGSWTLPNGTVLVQTLSLDVVDKSGKPTPKKVETRLLAREQGSGSATRTAGTPTRPTPSSSATLATARNTRLRTSPHPAADATRPGSSRRGPSACPAIPGPSASPWGSPPTSSTATSRPADRP